MPAHNDQTVDLDFQHVDGDADMPPPDDLFRALASSIRRQILSVLASEAALTLDELADILVGWESTSDGPAGPDERAQIKIELVHAHLPLLSDAGLIAVEDETVRRVGMAEPVEAAIGLAVEYDDLTASGAQ